MKQYSGFSLMEVMVVLAIVAILATLALPSQSGAIMQKRVLETIMLVQPYKSKIMINFKDGKFPATNEEAGLPEADKIISNYMEKMEVRGGAMHIHFGQKMPPQLQQKILSLQPVYVKDSPNSPVDWICGFDEVPLGMIAAGNNLTDIDIQYLPGRCR